MTIDEFLIGSLEAKDRFWFVRDFITAEHTDSTVTLHFIINSELFVQVFYSERGGRLSFALVGQSGRLYGRDREHNYWHRHPFGQTDVHEPTPEGMSSQPVNQFLTEVEEILIENELI